MSKNSCSFLYRDLLFENEQDFVDTEYYFCQVDTDEEERLQGEVDPLLTLNREPSHDRRRYASLELRTYFNPPPSLKNYPSIFLKEGLYNIWAYICNLIIYGETMRNSLFLK